MVKAYKRKKALCLRFPWIAGATIAMIFAVGSVVYAQDLDLDGWTDAEGDCCESPLDCPNPVLVNPGAIEIPFNSVDDDCNADTPDNALAGSCSASAKFSGVTPEDLARAMDICQLTDEVPASEQERTWGLIEATFRHANNDLPSASRINDMSNQQAAVLANFGSNVAPQSGVTMAAMSSGVMRDANDPGFVNPDPGTNFGQTGDPPIDFLAAHGGSLPSGQSCNGACPAGSGANDSVSINLRIRVPTNVDSFSYRFKFTSSEYPNYLCSYYNDFHLALLDSGAPGIPADKNIALDAFGNPVSVNNVNFEVCSPTGCYTCPEGTAELAGTGFDDLNGAASTVWLEATAPVVPGEIITLRLMIFDASDGSDDSSVLLDDFQWHPICGNGSLDTGEQCDDGNSTDGDGCSAACSLESCGDGVLDPSEECDDGNNVGNDGCSAICTVEECGDGIIQGAEECDDGNSIDGDGCSADCLIEEDEGLAPEQERALSRALAAQGRADSSQVRACRQIQSEIDKLISDGFDVPPELQSLFDDNCP